MAAATLTSAMIGAVFSMITALESVTGFPIVVLDRTGNDPQAFWHSAAVKLCGRTNENFCDNDLVFLTDNTNPMGWSRVLTYTGRTSNQTKKVCLVLQPDPEVSPAMLATGLSAGTIFGPETLPTSPDAWVWLMLQAAANCVVDSDAAMAERRADAFATLGLTLIDGDPASTRPAGIGSARFFQAYRHPDANRWAANLGERYQFDMWKAQAVTAIPAATGCTAFAVASTQAATDAIVRDTALQPNDACINFGGGATNQGNVTDANLHIWMYGSGIGAPPIPWVPYMGFTDWATSTTWTWTSATSLARQYTN